MFKRTLENAWVFDLKQRLVTGGFRSMRQAFQAHFPLNSLRDQHILDVGCGTGLCTAKLFDAQNNYVVGIDFNDHYIKLAQRLYPDIHFIVGEAESLPKYRHFFDVVLISSVLHHLSDDQSLSLFESLQTSMTDQATILVSEPIWSSNAFSNFLLRRDRGQFVKDKPGYLNLLNPNFRIEKAFEYTYAKTQFMGAILKLK